VELVGTFVATLRPQRRILQSTSSGGNALDASTANAGSHPELQSLTPRNTTSGWQIASFRVDPAYFTVWRIIQFIFIFLACILMCAAYYWLYYHFKPKHYQQLLQHIIPVPGGAPRV